MLWWMVRQAARLRKIFSPHDEPYQRGLAVAMGISLGLIPKDNLIVFTLALVSLCLPINLVITAMVAIPVSLMGTFLDPMMGRLGTQVLQHPISRNWMEQMYQQPVLRWTHFYNTVVMGSTIVSILQFLPTYWISSSLLSIRFKAKKKRLSRLDQATTTPAPKMKILTAANIELSQAQSDALDSLLANRVEEPEVAAWEETLDLITSAANETTHPSIANPNFIEPRVLNNLPTGTEAASGTSTDQNSANTEGSSDTPKRRKITSVSSTTLNTNVSQEFFRIDPAQPVQWALMPHERKTPNQNTTERNSSDRNSTDRSSTDRNRGSARTPSDSGATDSSTMRLDSATAADQQPMTGNHTPRESANESTPVVRVDASHPTEESLRNAAEEHRWMLDTLIEVIRLRDTLRDPMTNESEASNRFSTQRIDSPSAESNSPTIQNSGSKGSSPETSIHNEIESMQSTLLALSAASKNSPLGSTNTVSPSASIGSTPIGASAISPSHIPSIAMIEGRKSSGTEASDSRSSDSQEPRRTDNSHTPSLPREEALRYLIRHLQNLQRESAE